jgi:hypothetical protein
MTKANAVLATATVVFGSGCFVLFRDLGIERNRVQTLEAQLAELKRDLQASEPTSAREEPAPTSEPPVQAVAATPAASSTSASTTPAISKPAAAKRRAELDEWRRMLADPAYREAMRAQHRLQLEPQYAELAAELGLSQDEADRFLDLLAEQSLRESEYGMKDDPGANSENWEERRRRLKERHEQAENERRACSARSVSVRGPNT